MYVGLWGTSELMMDCFFGEKPAVGIFWERGKTPQERKFFSSLAAAKSKIEEVALDKTVTGIWVGCREEDESCLEELLHSLRVCRDFALGRISKRNLRVFDLFF